MAKKFVRSITGIKDINKQDLSTNNVGDLLSDGKDIYVHRKTPNGDEYFNLTSGNGGGSTTEKPLNLVALEGSGIEIWKDGDNTNVQLSAEFLKNNAQWLEGVNGIKVTNRQDKYGKSFTLELDDDTKAKLAKIDKLEEGGGTTTPVTIKNTDGNLTITDGSTINLASSVANKLNTPIPRVEVVSTNLQLDTTYNDNRQPTRYKISIPSRYTDYVLSRVNEGSSYMNVSTFQGSRNIDLSDDTKAKIDKIDGLTAGTIQDVENTDGNLTVAINNYKATINASDTMKAKLDTVESVETDVSKLKTRVTALENGAGGEGTGGASTTVTNSDGYLKVTTENNNADINLSDTAKAQLEKISGIETKVTSLNDTVTNNQANIDKVPTIEQNVTALDGRITVLENGGGNTQVTADDNKEQRLTNPDGSLLIIKGANGGTDKTKIQVDPKVVVTRNTLTGGDGINVTKETTMTSYNSVVSLDDTTKASLAKVTPLESKVTELENNAFAPVYNSALINGIRYTLVALPYGTAGNYLATITLETSPIASSSPAYLSRTQKFNKYLSNMSFPSAGYLQSGCILMKQNDGQIEIHTANDSGAGKVQGQFTVILSSL